MRRTVTCTLGPMSNASIACRTTHAATSCESVCVPRKKETKLQLNENSYLRPYFLSHHRCHSTERIFWVIIFEYMILRFVTSVRQPMCNVQCANANATLSNTHRLTHNSPTRKAWAFVFVGGNMLYIVPCAIRNMGITVRRVHSQLKFYAKIQLSICDFALHATLISHCIPHAHAQHQLTVCLLCGQAAQGREDMRSSCYAGRERERKGWRVIKFKMKQVTGVNKFNSHVLNRNSIRHMDCGFFLHSSHLKKKGFCDTMYIRISEQHWRAGQVNNLARAIQTINAHRNKKPKI